MFTCEQIYYRKKNSHIVYTDRENNVFWFKTYKRGIRKPRKHWAPVKII